MSPTPPSTSAPSSESLPQNTPAGSEPSSLATPHSAPSSSPTDPLRRLIDETSDLIDSPTAAHILTLLLDTLFSHLTDHVLRTQAFRIPISNQSDPSQRVQEILDDPSSDDPKNAKAKLATILAVITRQAHAIGNGVPNEYVQGMESVRELEAFAAVVYSSNFEFEAGVDGEVQARDEGLEEGEGKRAGLLEGGRTRVVDAAPSVVEAGRGIVASAWGAGAWDGIWAKVVGGGQAPITG